MSYNKDIVALQGHIICTIAALLANALENKIIIVVTKM